MKGVSRALHLAADYRLWSPNPDELFSTNVEGTRIVMSEAFRSGVERIVHTSSVATLKPSADGAPADKSARLSEDEAIGAYKKSKIAAERLVEAMAAEGRPVVIVNPTAPIGPGDLRPTPTGRFVMNAAAGRMPGFVDTGLNVVHVDDVAFGHLLALERGRIGERYILGGGNVSLIEILAAAAREGGRPPPRIRIPRGLVLPVAFAAEAIAHVTGREPFVTRDGLRMSKARMFFTSAKAERELGFTARPWQEAVADAVRWFRDAGYLDAGARMPALSAQGE